MTPILVACGIATLICSLYTIILPTWDAIQAKKQTQSVASAKPRQRPTMVHASQKALN